VTSDLDEDQDGEIPRREISTFLKAVGRDPKPLAAQIEAFCFGSKGNARGIGNGDITGNGVVNSGARRADRHEEARRRRGKSEGRVDGREERSWRSTACLAEVLASFGFVFEAVGAPSKPSVAAAFAMLRLCSSPTEVRVAGETAIKYLDNVLTDPRDSSRWRVNTQNDAYFTKVGRHKGGRELLAAVGFSDEFQANPSLHGGSWVGNTGGHIVQETKMVGGIGERSKGRKGWLVLEGTVGADGKPNPSVGETQLRVLRAAREEVEAEIMALEGAPSISAALRELSLKKEAEAQGTGTESETWEYSKPSPKIVQAAAELLLTYVVNALQNPRDPRVHRVRAANPVYQRNLGRLGGCEGAMLAVGFQARDRGTVFVLRRLGVDSEGVGQQGGKVGTQDFTFPALDTATEAFLWRRKADLEAAIESLCTATDDDGKAAGATGGVQGAPGRAKADLADSRVLFENMRGTELGPRKIQDVPITKALGTQNTRRRGTSQCGTSIPLGRRGKFRGRGRGYGGGRGKKQGQLVVKGLSGVHQLQHALIREAFVQLDVDGDDIISAQDLRTAFRNIGRDASDRCIHAWIRKRDISQNGCVTFKEFLASFHSLIPPDNPGWATISDVNQKQNRGNSGGGGSQTGKDRRKNWDRSEDEVRGEDNESDDWEDGASPVAAALGALRISASLPECKVAVEYALDYIRRVRDAPSTPAHWRIPLASTRFKTAVGRLLGGVGLMQSLGMELEENGTVLALREITGRGTKNKGTGGGLGASWERVPASILERLDKAAQALEAQAHGLEHPEVPDLAGVSAAVGRKRGHGGRIEPPMRCVEAAMRYAQNILDHP
ncbi:unnamed protein product, partial [Choristocarpus tenellus]